MGSLFKISSPILLLLILINPAFTKDKNPKSQTAIFQEKELSDTAYKFDQNKLDDAKDVFQFLRTFVDYFYLVSKNNFKNIDTIQGLISTEGWCVGDAHPENFGVLIKEKNALTFSHNDMDDSAPAPVIFDLYRLMVSSRLYDSSIDLTKMLLAYIAGLKHTNYPVPSPIQEMFQKSKKNGVLPSKNKVSKNVFIRTPEMLELPASDFYLLGSIVEILKKNLEDGASLIDAVQTKKIGGGSGGLLRYELLINNGGKLLHLELKTQVTPSLYPVASSIPSLAERIEQSLKVGQGIASSQLYKVINFKGQEMLLRPKFSGNIGVSLDKNSLPDNQDIIYYESYVLGGIHSRSIVNSPNWVNLLQKVNKESLEKDVVAMTIFLNKKFNALKK